MKKKRWERKQKVVFINIQSNSIKNFAVVDAAMNDLIRPSLYKAFHQIVKVNVDDVTNDPSVVDVQDDGNDGDVIAGRWDIVGPICETGDFLGKNRLLSLQEGELLAKASSRVFFLTESSGYSLGATVEPQAL